MTNKNEGMDFEDYVNSPGLSQSQMKELLRSPLHYKYQQGAPRESTPTQVLGTLAHMAVLEPKRFDSLVCVEPEVDRRTKAGKEELARFHASEPKGAIYVRQKIWEAALGMRQAVLANPTAAALLGRVRTEHSLFWTDEVSGVPCKARLDALSSDDIVIDLKTTTDARAEYFSRDAAKYFYDLQVAHYTAAAASCLGKHGFGFLFMVVESAPPFGFSIFEAGDSMVVRGEENRRLALEIFSECSKTQTWPGLPADVQTLELPPYARSKDAF